ncbi:metallophosphoesterase [Brevibacillus sp. NPDC058079]|uniref:metallophosphoesterase n=1 Tax=Brevibacillus sp. NPDC058079 TaxID=3346330 RepID=UPI0036EAC792
MLMKTSLHTIFILVGPTECGKSTFAQEVLVPQLQVFVPTKNFQTNVQVISSDEIRRDILGYAYDKHDSIMMEASEQAFDLLDKKLRAVTSFPINAEFVIVDTKGLSEEFRNQVCKIAELNNYNVEVILFDYKDTQEYYRAETKNRALISRDVRRLRSEVLASLRKGKYRQVHRIKSKDFLNEDFKANVSYKVEIENLDEYMKAILPADKEYFIVGDVHEDVNALKKLFREKGFSLEGDKLSPNPKYGEQVAILVGDFIDKGKNTEEIIRFLSQNREFIKLVKGNHENFVYKVLKGDLSASDYEEELIQTQFTSIEVLQKDEPLREMFYELVESSIEFYRYIGVRKNSFYVTHAPCANKYLGKLDSTSLRKQRNLPLDRQKDLQEELHFLQKEAVSNHPYHIFGHIASKNGIRLKNKLGIDTGSVYGNRLLSVSFGGGKIFFKSVEGSSVEPVELPGLFERKKENVSLDALNDDDRRRLQFVLRNKINFISGTISPADKNEETGELESLSKGLEYFKSKGVQQVTLQPKYMGSRCTVYLGKTVEESYAVSRNGYKIRNVDLTGIFADLIDKFAGVMAKNSWKMMILDGELLPWMALGKGLIEREFKVMDVALSGEIEFLKENGFEESSVALFDTYKESDFSKDQHNLSKKELIAKYGESTYGNYKHVRDVLYSYYPLSAHEEAYKLYHEQVELYGSEAELSFKPFALLKSITEDGSEVFPSVETSKVFAMISDDEYLVVDFSDPNYFEKANAFYQTLTTDRKMEGVVVKPEIEKEGVAPAIKVRNTEYLRIIYGYDYTFPHKYGSLFSQKRIGKKLATSINEHEIGKKMLSFPIDSIDMSNRDYQQVVANMLFETSRESEIDPRL